MNEQEFRLLLPKISNWYAQNILNAICQFYSQYNGLTLASLNSNVSITEQLEYCHSIIIVGVDTGQAVDTKPVTHTFEVKLPIALLITELKNKGDKL